MRKLSTLLLFICSFFVTKSDAQTLVPFDTFDVVTIAKPGYNAAPPNYTMYLRNNDELATSFVNHVSMNLPFDLNGIGFNPNDKYIYGIAFSNNSNNTSTSLYRIGKNGNYENLGQFVLNQPTNNYIEYLLPNAGTVTSGGIFYFLTLRILQSGLLKLAQNSQNPGILANDVEVYILGVGPVQTLPKDTANITNFNNLSLRYKLDLTADSIVKHGFEKFLEELNTNMNNYYATFGGVQDIVYNPFDATIYGYMSYRDGAQK